jgi:hypothetical protein
MSARAAGGRFARRSESGQLGASAQPRNAKAHWICNPVGPSICVILHTPSHDLPQACPHFAALGNGHELSRRRRKGAPVFGQPSPSGELRRLRPFLPLHGGSRRPLLPCFAGVLRVETPILGDPKFIRVSPRQIPKDMPGRRPMRYEEAVPSDERRMAASSSAFRESIREAGRFAVERLECTCRACLDCPEVAGARSQLMIDSVGGSPVCSARFSRRQPTHRRCPLAPAGSDNSLYGAYALQRWSALRD